MLSRLISLSTISALALVACATPQENPYYKYSSKYNGGSTTTVTEAGSIIQTAPVNYQSTTPVSYSASTTPSYSSAEHDCFKKEKNHELLGAAIGGSVGAYAGKKLIGGTEGTVLGAGLGGAAGYGIGDKTVNCDPQPVPTRQVSAPISQSYTAAPTTTTIAPTTTASYTPPAAAQSYVSPTDTQFDNISSTGTPGYQVLQAQSAPSYQPSVTPAASYGSLNGAKEVAYDYSHNTIVASADTAAPMFETRVLGRGGYGSHVVKQGDTVYSLSRRLCVSVTDIQSLNNLNASYGINIGDTLQLPPSAC